MSAKKKTWADAMTGFMEKIAPVFDQPILASVRDGFVPSCLSLLWAR
jgi:hypothetical protein